MTVSDLARAATRLATRWNKPSRHGFKLRDRLQMA